jgi:crotonobetainyl-CoA:carnitine CoA-transferase CaiB-like acyl-CoA transferase
MGPDHEWLWTHERTDALQKRLTYANAPFVHQTLEDWLQGFDHVADVERMLRAAGVPAMRVRSFEEVCDAPYIQDREMLVKMKQPFAGEFEIYNSPLKMSETPGQVMGYAPLLGEHNREILASKLGYDEETIDNLFQAGVLYREPAVDRLPEEWERLNGS